MKNIIQQTSYKNKINYISIQMRSQKVKTVKKFVERDKIKFYQLFLLDIEYTCIMDLFTSKNKITK